MLAAAHMTLAKDACKAKMDEIRELFKNSIEVLASHVRLGEAEHFGWRDGISQPALAYVGRFPAILLQSQPS